MRDADVRAAVRRVLDTKYSGDNKTRIVEEMGLWSGSVRIDIAVINGRMHGFELKSARDNLIRLQTQAEMYSEVFDRVTLVTAENHFRHALKTIPKWWDVWVVIEGGKGISIDRRRKGTNNRCISGLQLARLLWRDESLALLEGMNLDTGMRSATREALAQELATRLRPSDLARLVRSVLKNRARPLGQCLANN